VINVVQNVEKKTTHFDFSVCSCCFGVISMQFLLVPVSSIYSLYTFLKVGNFGSPSQTNAVTQCHIIMIRGPQLPKELEITMISLCSLTPFLLPVLLQMCNKCSQMCLIMLIIRCVYLLGRSTLLKQLSIKLRL